MPRNGSGVYTLPQAAFVNGTTADAAAVNSNNNDIATALTGSLPRDGEAPPTANLPMGNFKLTGLTPGTNTGDSVAYGQAASFSSVALAGAITGVTSLTSTGVLLVQPASGDAALALTRSALGAGQVTLNLVTTGGSTWQLFNPNGASTFNIYNSALGQTVMSMTTAGNTSCYADFITGGNNYPSTNNATTSGVSANRWANVYSVLGNFSGAVGINGKTPVSSATAPAAATDLPSTLTLINDIRAKLIAFGIYT